MPGIITLPLVSLRVSSSESSELSTQLMFGERVEVFELGERWIHVRNQTDNCIGWVDSKMLHILSVEEEKRLSSSPFFCIPVPFLVCDKPVSHQQMYLPGGSYFPSYNYGRCIIDDEIYQINMSSNQPKPESLSQQITSNVLQYLNAPHLCGGKSVMGIDCSGLVQVVFAMSGINLLRKVMQQVEFGRVIDFLFEAQPGDLVFFENPEREIVHVGILLNTHQIIHTSGCVKIDSIDSQGIISSKTGEYTHTLRVIKRII
jgi:gamma-D-glutamyl-L-lysine dipeptidyl-peptidase